MYENHECSYEYHVLCAQLSGGGGPVIVRNMSRLMQSVHPARAGELSTDDVQRQHCRVAAAHRFLKNATYHDVDGVSAAFVLGGVDTTGPHLYAIGQDGSSSKGPFAALGSGSMAALSVLESEYQDGISEEAAMDLVCLAIAAGIDNDLGSGSNIGLCIIRKHTVEYHRSYRQLQLQQPQRTARMPPSSGGGTTDVIKRVRQTRTTAAATSVVRRSVVRPALRTAALQTASTQSQVGGVRLRIDDSIELL
ncbi:nucleophile aminohydrolase [Tribonema minus]|uniref:Nucleophile aminohydrolase n=1 Tax=Tribonema minus TaxID=303371 RepID=A0A835YWM5_9STRA|nr:nucleophile aminohydrolase [Tribonema minus]